MKNQEIKWTCTDIDNGQYGRRISARVFEFKENNRFYDANDDNSDDEIIEMTINLDHYSKDSMYDMVCAYYGYEDFEDSLKPLTACGLLPNVFSNRNQRNINMGYTLPCGCTPDASGYGYCGECTRKLREKIWREMPEKKKNYDRHFAPEESEALDYALAISDNHSNDEYNTCCSCHINPPCSYCMSKNDEGE